MKRVLFVLVLAAGCTRPGTSSSSADAGSAASPDAGAPGVGGVARCDAGTPVFTETWVSPTGDDTAAGTLVAPLRTLEAAWQRVPAELDAAWRINLLPGSYPCGDDEMNSCINRFEGRHGTAERPLVIRSVDATGAPAHATATLRGGLDLADVRHFHLVDVRLVAGGALPTNASGNDVLHVAGGDHVLIRSVVAEGPPGRTDSDSNIQEVLKTNQVDHLYVEDSDFSGTFQTPVDIFSARHGHMVGNRVHGAGGRCTYIKGGSAYWVVAENEFFDCREAGFQAGEGSTFNLMTPPFLHHEAYDLKVFNNVFHDIRGPGLSVAGGYNILFAYNTLYRVGLPAEGQQWSMMQLVLGGRACVTVDEFPTDELARARCQEMIDVGGWGSATAGPIFTTGGDWIPNHGVFIFNNVFHNPAGSEAAMVLGINAPLALPADARNIPDPAPSDDNLVLRGNLVWNGSNAAPLIASTGGGEPGCADGHPTCAAALILADNAVGTVEPLLRDPGAGDFRPLAGGAVEGAAAVDIPAFTWASWPAGSGVPEGTLANTVSTTMDGRPRSTAPHPGAY